MSLTTNTEGDERMNASEGGSLNLSSCRLSRFTTLIPDDIEIVTALDACKNKINDLQKQVKVCELTRSNLDEVFDLAYPAATSKNPSLHRFLQKINRTLNVANTQTGLVGRGGSSFGIGFRAMMISAISGGLGTLFLKAFPGIFSIDPYVPLVSAAYSQFLFIGITALIENREAYHSNIPFIYRFDRKSMSYSGVDNPLSLLPCVLFGAPLQLLKTITIDAYQAQKRRNNDSAELRVAKRFLQNHPKDSSLQAKAVISETVNQYHEIEIARLKCIESIDLEQRNQRILKEMFNIVKNFPQSLLYSVEKETNNLSHTFVHQLYKVQYQRIKTSLGVDNAGELNLEEIAKDVTPLESISELPKELEVNRDLISKLFILAGHPELYIAFKQSQLKDRYDDAKYNQTQNDQLNKLYREYCTKVFDLIDEIVLAKETESPQVD